MTEETKIETTEPTAEAPVEVKEPVAEPETLVIRA